MTRIHVCLCFLAATLRMSVGAEARAQATPAAGRSFEVAVFGEYARLHPDYGPALNGLTAGLDLSRPILNGLLIPALEVRVNYAGETSLAGEQVALGGLRLGFGAFRSPRLSPYLNFLIGAGQIDFTHGSITDGKIYSRDNSVVYNYGAGVDYEIAHHFAIQLEFQHQNWDLGSVTYSLTPSSYNVGVRYTIPSL